MMSSDGRPNRIALVVSAILACTSTSTASEPTDAPTAIPTTNPSAQGSPQGTLQYNVTGTYLLAEVQHEQGQSEQRNFILLNNGRTLEVSVLTVHSRPASFFSCAALSHTCTLQADALRPCLVPSFNFLVIMLHVLHSALTSRPPPAHTHTHTHTHTRHSTYTHTCARASPSPPPPSLRSGDGTWRISVRACVRRGHCRRVLCSGY